MKTAEQKRKLLGWIIPLTYMLTTLVVGMVFPRLEHHYLKDMVSSISAPSAVAICSSLASGMIALTGIVFSMAFVMVQFSATAYSPRLVLWVARDPVVSHALGVFSATFLYALMLIAWIDREAAGRVPLISGWLVLALLVASMGMFIALIERVGLLQVNRMLIFTGDQGRKAIEELYPHPDTLGDATDTDELRDRPVVQTLVYSGRPQAIQAVHLDAFVRMARDSDAVIELVAAVGDTVLEKSTLLHVHGARQPLDEDALMNALEIGDERTFEQDPKYAIRLVVDIAIKALSPAINDPTTAVQALDQVEDILIRLGHRHLNIGNHRDDRGVLRLLVPCPGWEDFLRLALDEIRSCGANSVQVMRRMNALISNLKRVLPSGRHEALSHWEGRLQGTVERSFADKEEKKDASVADRQGLGIGEEKSDQATDTPAVPATPSVHEKSN